MNFDSKHHIRSESGVCKRLVRTSKNTHQNIDVISSKQKQENSLINFFSKSNKNSLSISDLYKRKPFISPSLSSSKEKDLIKVVVIGESGSGKSNLIQRLVKNRFDERSPSTIGIDFALFEFEYPLNDNNNQNQTYHAQIWDTAGMERYRSSITKIFYRDVFGALLVFDITKRDHFDALPRWLREIRSNVHRFNDQQQFDVDDNMPIILVGNKSDLVHYREVERREALKFVKQYQLDSYIETSAKNNTNVQEAFQQLFGNILEIQRRRNNEQMRMITLSKKDQKQKALKKSNKDHHESIKLTRDKYYLEQRNKISRNEKRYQKDRCGC